MTLAPAPLVEKEIKPETPFFSIIDAITQISLYEKDSLITDTPDNNHEGRMQAFHTWLEAFKNSNPENQQLLDSISQNADQAIYDWLIHGFCLHSANWHEHISQNPSPDLPGLDDYIKQHLLKVEHEALKQVIPLLDSSVDRQNFSNYYVDSMGSVIKIWNLLKGMGEYGNPKDLLRRFSGELLATLPYAPDQLHFSQNLPDTNPSTPESNLAIQFEYLARGFFNQFVAELNPEAAERRLASFLEYVASFVYEVPAYTNQETATRVLTEVLQTEDMTTEETLVLGVGAGVGADVASLKNVGVTHFDAIDAIPQPTIQEQSGINFAQSDLLNYAPNKLFKRILCTGSGLLNQESLLRQLQYWLKITKLLESGGKYFYEAGVLDPDQASNYLFEMARAYNEKDSMHMLGDIPRRKAYQQEHETNETFGAHIFPDFVTKLFGKLVGLNCQKTVTYQTKEDAYRAVYVFEKTGDPHPLSQILLTAASLSADRLRGAVATAK